MTAANETKNDLEEAPAKIRVKDEDQKIIKEINQELSRAKMELANIAAQAESLAMQRAQAAQQVISLDRSLYDRIKKTAAEYGLNPDERPLDFDISTMTFTRI
jgi:LDH2 family malate/lactate/ureidoglycolate dehydrogenase